MTIKLKNLVQKANFQLIDAVKAHQAEEVIIDVQELNEVLKEVDDKQQAKNTVLFLGNMLKHQSMFNDLVKGAKDGITEGKRAELTTDELETFAVGKAITTLKAMQTLKGKITAEQAGLFFGVQEAIINDLAKADKPTTTTGKPTDKPKK